MLRLKVNEIFGPTIQGEGRSLGKEVIFLRLSQCNLHCIWCDTPYTWNWAGTPFKHPIKYMMSQELHDMTWWNAWDQIHNLAHFNRPIDKAVKAIVISGGEPLLQQKQLQPLIEQAKLRGYWIEIETNGTVRPMDGLLDSIDQINCSPKLENSGEPQSAREKPQALTVLAASNKVTFKFVITDQASVEEVKRLVQRYKMKHSNVYLMPEGRTVEELRSREDFVKDACQKEGFIFTPRQHIIQFGARRGV